MTSFLSPLVPLIGEFAVALAMGVFSAVGVRLLQWLRLGSDDRIRRYLGDALERAVDLAEARLMRRLGEGRVPSEADWQGAAMEAAGYLRDRVPDALRHFGVTPQGLAEMVEARLLPRR
jgi:hypothetical protein